MKSQRRSELEKPIPPLLLNMQMLVDGCSDLLLEPMFYRHEHDKCKLEDVQLYYGQKELRENCVYLADADTFRRNPIDNQDICLLSVGDPGEWYQSMANPMLVFPETATVPFLLNTVLGIFRRYADFEVQLHRALGSGGLSDLCLSALGFFQNPLFIHDENFIMLCRPQYVLGMTDVDVDPETGVAMFKMDLINHFKTDQDYLKTMSIHRASLWVKNSRPYFTPYRVLYMNLFDGSGRYRGRICVNEINSSIYPSQFLMLEYFSLFVIRALTRVQRGSRREHTSFEAFLRSYLRGSPPSREAALRLIGGHKWQEHDTYFCAKVQMTDRDLAVNALDNAVRTLSMRFPRCSVFLEDSHIWLVENLTLEGMEEAVFLEHLREFARSGMFPVGVSGAFHDFFRLRSGFEQAGVALEYAAAQNGAAVFPQLANRFFMDCVAQRADPEAVCHERLFELRAADAERGTDYYRTLRAYLENERNMTETAQSLHVHRSTLQYRIDRLQEMTQLSFDDPELRLYLLNCFRLLDRSS